MEYKEIKRLHEMLEGASIPHTFEEHYLRMGGYHIEYPCMEDCACSVIETPFSFGAKMDLLEIMGLAEDAVQGYLTAEDVFNRILNDWKNRGE